MEIYEKIADTTYLIFGALGMFILFPAAMCGNNELAFVGAGFLCAAFLIMIGRLIDIIWRW